MVRRTKDDAQATRSQLLDAAERVFAEKGVSRTSLNDIAAAAGTTRGAIYWHFKNKADVFNAMMDRVILPMEAAFLSRWASEADPDPVAELQQRHADGPAPDCHRRAHPPCVRGRHAQGGIRRRAAGHQGAAPAGLHQLRAVPRSAACKTPHSRSVTVPLPVPSRCRLKRLARH
jgi:AcrR family transcriptional regulator